MNIACDARALAGPLTGVGRWTVHVMGGLAARFAARVLLAAPGPIDVPPGLADVPGVTVLPPPRLGIPGTLWLHTALPRRLEAAGADVFVASLAIVPRGCPVPAVAVVHDLTPRTHPSRHTLANRFCFNAYLEESLERAAAVVAVSRATAAILLATFPRVRDRLRVIPNGVGPFFSPDPDTDGAAVRERFAGGRPYVLHLGTLEPRKGLLTLVEAWDRLHGLMPDPPDLVVAGAPGWGVEPILRRIRRSPHAAGIHLAGRVADREARDLLRHAEVFVTASEEEGFGLPLAEAICCGAACVATAVPALVETAGGAALLAPVNDAAALADALARALEPEVNADLRRRAAQRCAGLRWEPAVAAWHELLEAVAAG